jgi:FlaA1/EpsC-like NDP-sugar epimerase
MVQHEQRSSTLRNLLAMAALVAADIVVLLLCVVAALWLRYDADNAGLAGSRVLEELSRHALTLAVALGCYGLVFSRLRLYSAAWRFASLEILWSVVVANGLGLLILVSLQALFDRTAAGGMSTFPRSSLLMILVFGTMLIGGMRMAMRVVLQALGRARRAATHNHPAHSRVTRAVIIGAGNDGARLLAALREDGHHGGYEVIGLLDDDRGNHGQYVRGARVLGAVSHIYQLLADNAVDEVLIRIPDAHTERVREIVMACRKQQVRVKVIPTISDVMNGRARAHLEDISVEDLLRRAPVHINISEIGHNLTGRSVLVTGAGGSIGSELCRQILAMNPSRLILLGHGENSLHRIHQELAQRHPEAASRLFVVVASCADDLRIDHVFDHHLPQVVFHAAAHKHVPLMEANIQEAITNNVLGTRNVAEACGRYGIERMLLISTDKAVSPSSIMGASKWLCEELLRALVPAYPGTTYVTVRFGNVLGSRGSVVPVFRQQIQQGGPVTVTHPEMTRFFMTIPEAVQLVLQAGAIGASGDLFLLDMGKPVRIVDLARDMIRLSGLEPDVDIPVTFTGLRPGEKLHEQLSTADELIRPAACEGMSMVQRRHYFTPGEYRDVLKRLQQLAMGENAEDLLDYMGEIVPSFAQQRLLSHTLPVAEGQDVAAR